VDGATVEQTAGKSARSNLTFSGKEDLGNGMSAYFGLNMRFNPENGTTNPGGNVSTVTTSNGTNGTGAVANTNNPNVQIFRNSWVGLNTNAGAVQMGRFLAPFQELNGNYDAFGTDTVGSVHVNAFNTGAAGNVRVNSALEYRSPVLGGAQVLLMTADTNAQGIATPTVRPFSAAVSFNQGPVSLGVGTDKKANDLKTLGVYGKFTLPSNAAVMFQYEKGDVSATTTSKGYSISTKVPVGAFDLKAGYLTVKPSVGASQKKLGLGVDYNLSKRTQLYVDMGKRSGDALTVDNKKNQFDVGIFHKF
ncbi:MAG: porin, partial [Leptothrix sp. (in: b-proteobacteria)]